MDFQNFSAIGTVTKAATVHGDPPFYATFVVAVSTSLKKDETDYFPVRVFNPLTETAAQMKPKSRVFISGPIQIWGYESQDPITSTRGIVVADCLLLL